MGSSLSLIKFPISAPPLPAEITLGLLRDGFTCVSELPPLSSPLVSSQALEAVQSCISKLPLPVMVSSNASLGYEEPLTRTPIITLIEGLDRALGGGVQVRQREE